jgi:Chaperone of endosialidase
MLFTSNPCSTAAVFVACLTFATAAQAEATGSSMDAIGDIVFSVYPPPVGGTQSPPGTVMLTTTGGLTTTGPINAQDTASNAQDITNGGGALAAAITGTANADGATGVYGVSNSTANYSMGVYGAAAGTTGQNYGVRGITYSTTNGTIGVYGGAAGATGSSSGVWGETISTTNGASGVEGVARGTTGVTYGVYGRTVSTTNGAAGVQGYASGATGATYGVYGSVVSIGDAAGLYGAEAGANNTGYAVLAFNDSPTGWGVYSSGTSPNYFAGWVGIKTATPTEALDVNGQVHIASFASAGSVSVCQNKGVLASCSSSIRYKENVKDGTFGLKDVMLMRPVTFKWKGRDENDFGLIAEEIEKINPLFVTYTGGQIEGVKYPQLTAVLVNAVKDEAAQIAALRSDFEAYKAAHK